jgi:hypothetical protein
MAMAMTMATDTNYVRLFIYKNLILQLLHFLHFSVSKSLHSLTPLLTYSCTLLEIASMSVFLYCALVLLEDTQLSFTPIINFTHKKTTIFSIFFLHFLTNDKFKFYLRKYNGADFVLMNCTISRCIYYSCLKRSVSPWFYFFFLIISFSQ